MHVKRLIPLLLALSLLAGVARAAPSADLEITRHVIGAGGGHLEQGPYALDATVGQAAVGRAIQPPFALCAGYWCSAAVSQIGGGHQIYLPLITR